MRDALRDHVIRLLTTPWAHPTVLQAVAGLPPRLRGARAPGFPHTPWQLLEHLRICQHDLLEYSRSAKHVSPEFPDGYWPDRDAPGRASAWKRSVGTLRSELRDMVALVRAPSTDLLRPLPWSPEGHTVLREALILADHHAYHAGQIVQLRRALGAWDSA